MKLIRLLENLFTESRINDLRQQLVGKAISSTEFDQVVNIPVIKPTYTEWLIKVFIKEFKQKGKSISDFMEADVAPKLEFFEKNKSLFSNKDILSYSFYDLNKNIDKIKGQTGPASQALSVVDLNKLTKVGIKNLGAIDGYQVLKIPKGNNSPEAFNVYRNLICQGRTHVCTASNYSKFEYYTTNDNLFILINPDDEQAPYHLARFNNSEVDKDDEKITNPRILNIFSKLK